MKIETSKTTCDGCDADLSYTNYWREEIITLGPKAIAHYPGNGPRFDCEKNAEISGDAHFCNIGCLAAWMAKAHPDGLKVFGDKQWSLQVMRNREAKSEKEPQ